MISVAFLGCDPDVLALANALRADPRFQVVGWFDAASARWRDVFPHLAPAPQWETLLASTVQVVIVGRERTAIEADDQLRKLVQAGVPLLLMHPPCEAILGLELEMIRRDAQGPLAIYYPGCRHAARTHMAELCAAQSTDRIEQILVERTMADRRAESVAAQFVRDVHWLQPLVGDVRQVSGFAAAPDDLANLSVQFTTEAGCLVRWSVRAADSQESGTIEIVGLSRKFTLESSSGDSPWRLTVGADQVVELAPPHARDALDIVNELAAVESAAQAKANAHAKAFDPQPRERDFRDWTMAVRALEVLDALQFSLKRGRTIELQKTQVSEQQTFKGVMSAVGCLLLLLAPLILIGAAVIDRLQASFRPRPTASAMSATSGTKAEETRGDDTASPPGQTGAVANPDQPDGMPRKFPWLGVALAAPLVVFLLLQGFQFVFPRQGESRGGKE